MSKKRDEAPNIARRTVANPTVLDEDEYEATLGKIIKRDFFPNLLKDEQDESSSGIAAPKRQGKFNSSWDDTPSQTPMQTPSLHSGPNKEVQKKAMENMSLNEFLATHTSEDNASFVQIKAEDAAKRKEKLAWLYDSETKAIEFKQKMLENNPEMKGEMLTWDFKAKNKLLWPPDAIEPTLNELPKDPVVMYKNTRFEDGFAVPAPKPRKPELDDQGNEKVNGFSMVYTPNIEPGAEATPFMTWGSIDGTPMILDEKPSFKLPERSREDQFVEKINKKLAKKRKLKARKLTDLESAIRASPLLSNTPFGRQLSSQRRTRSIHDLTPAARSLLRRTNAGSVSSSLFRSAYTPTPSHRTPSRTPRHPGKRRVKSKKRKDPNRTPAAITDGLL